MRVPVLKVFCCLAIATACYGQAAAQGSPGGPIAIVAGQPIYERDLLPEVGPRLLQLRNQEYQIKSRSLEDLIRRRLIEAEAKKRGLSPEKLLLDEVNSKVGEPTDGEVEGYYLAQKNQINKPLQEVEPQLRKALKVLRIQQARQVYADSLRARVEVSVLLLPPKVEVSYDPSRVRGDPKAPITIVEFSDFQCPYCKMVVATLQNLLTKYNGRVKLAFRDFPLQSIHQQADTAAEAARCGGEQGKFWEFHDALFADQSKLDEAGLVEHARSLGLDEQAFRSCLAADKFKAQIQEDVQEGTKAGVVGTPGFFVNGVIVNGAQPQAEFERIIEAELAAIGSQPAAQAFR